MILLSTPQSAFDVIVPFLILFACALMAFQDRLAAFAQTHRLASRGAGHVPLPLLASTFVLAIYGAYFGAGLGILTLAFLSILLPDDIQHSNALKGMLSLIINAIAVVYFALFGPVEWAPAAVMAAGAMAGGYLGVGSRGGSAPVAAHQRDRIRARRGRRAAGAEAIAALMGRTPCPRWHLRCGRQMIGSGEGSILRFDAAAPPTNGGHP